MLTLRKREQPKWEDESGKEAFQSQFQHTSTEQIENIAFENNAEDEKSSLKKGH